MVRHGQTERHERGVPGARTVEEETNATRITEEKRSGRCGKDRQDRNEHGGNRL